MPDTEADRQADAYWNNLVARGRQNEENAQAARLAPTQAPAPQERVVEQLEQRPRLILS